jgi:Protein of unknown function (DUF3987)
MSPREGGAERVRKAIDGAEEVMPEAPRPLMRELPPADPFPVDALGEVLAPAARAIHDRVQAPLAICGQSVLAAATLAVQGHADVELPTRQAKPLTNFFLTVAATGERKTAVDGEALWPVRKREAALREKFDAEGRDYDNSRLAWEKARDAATKNGKGKGNRASIKAALDALGPPPLPPLEPLLTCPEPTYEGVCKLLAIGWPSVGIFASEGGQFIGGHGMTEEAKLRTAAGLSAAWDGEPIKRVRGGDGVVVLPGRRLAIHLMAQPDVASALLDDRLLANQGILSRFLASAPDAASGRRMWHEPSDDSDAAMKCYGARLLQILGWPLPLASNTQNTLAPRVLPLSPEAASLWKRFYNHVERRVAAGGELEPVRGLANKLPEHAARLAAVLALVRNIEAGEVSSADMAAGIELAQHYAAEALRLFAASRVSAELHLADRTLKWLRAHWTREPAVSLPDIYQFGPNGIRDKAKASRVVKVLEDHGYLVRIEGGAGIDGKWRRDAWRLVPEV